MTKKKNRKKKKLFRNSGVTATISMALVLFLVGLITLSLFLARNMTNFVKENLNLSIVLNENTNERQTQQIESFLKKSNFTKSIQYISKEQALKEHIAYLGEDPQAFLGYNPLLAVFEVKLNTNYANSDSLQMIQNKLKQFGNLINEVSYQKDVVDEVNNNIQRISIVLIGLTIVLMLISFVLINNTIRLRTYSNRFLINTMRLVGAKSWFIRKPYIKQSVINGLIASMIALILLAGVTYYAVYNFGISLKVIDTKVMLIVSAIVILTGILLTAISSYISVGRYLRMRTDDYYYI
jgi:cell division transport system permease protein